MLRAKLVLTDVHLLPNLTSPERRIWALQRLQMKHTVIIIAELKEIRDLKRGNVSIVLYPDFSDILPVQHAQISKVAR